MAVNTTGNKDLDLFKQVICLDAMRFSKEVLKKWKIRIKYLLVPHLMKLLRNPKKFLKKIKFLNLVLRKVL